MNKRQYDLIVIGAGSGGLAAAETAAAFGKSVAIVESGHIGGTCVNNGCVPKKIMWYAAGLAHAIDDAPHFGIEAVRGRTDWSKLVAGRDSAIAAINAYWNGYVEATGIDRIHGFGRFFDARTIAVGDSLYAAPHIVIATGGEPIVPPLPGAELGITSDGFFALTEQPRRVAVIGGGYIGVELAGLLRALGSEVTLAAMEDRVLERFDPMIGEVLGEEIRRQGIDLRTGFRVGALRQGADGILVESAAGQLPGGFDQVIWAVGRRARTAGLHLDKAGLRSLPGGIIEVDAYENTSVPGIYAIGDITGKATLTPVAIAAGRRLGARLFGDEPDARVNYRNIPSVVFSHPAAGTVGMTEDEARGEFGAHAVRVYETRFTPMKYALAPHGAVTAMKLVCVGDEQRIAGIHLVGDGVDEMLQGFAVALNMGATKADLDRSIAIHPTSAEELVTMKAAQLKPDASALEWREAS
jgi:glutathione reductase (NADPH)